MPRPRKYATEADKYRAYRERLKEKHGQEVQECVGLVDAVRELRRAWLQLPESMRPQDIEFADAVQSVQLVTALLQRIGEGRLIDKPVEVCEFTEPGPAPAREITKRRRKQ